MFIGISLALTAGLGARQGGGASFPEWGAGTTLEWGSGNDLEWTVSGQPFGTEIDLFLIAGQSNAEGRGNSSLSPALDPANNAFVVSPATFALTAANDPVAGAITGSAWPAFANAWFAATGRKAIFLEKALGGSALLAAAAPGSNWSDAGALKLGAQGDFAAVIRHFEMDVSYRIIGKYVLWCQGEADAVQINGTTVTAALYEAALDDLVTQWASLFGLTTFAIFRTGTVSTDLTGTTDVNFAAIRAAQDAVQAANPTICLDVFKGANLYPAQSKMSDTLHYTQAGYEQMGATGAEKLAAGINDT